MFCATPTSRTVIERAGIGRRRDEALSEIVNLRTRIATGRAVTLADAAAAIVQRAALADALIDGRGVQELDAKGKAAAEIKAVWRWIKRRV